MRKRKPEIATLDQVRISREGDDAVIEYRDPTIATTYFHIGPALRTMSDQEVLDSFNDMLRGEDERCAALPEHVAVEIPAGHPQVRYFARGDQWVPRGAVLRCVIDDAGPDGEAVIHIDDHSLSLPDFGRLLCTYAGWGMRITFVPEESLAVPPQITVGEPDDDEELDE